MATLTSFLLLIPVFSLTALGKPLQTTDPKLMKELREILHPHYVDLPAQLQSWVFQDRENASLNNYDKEEQDRQIALVLASVAMVNAKYDEKKYYFVEPSTETKYLYQKKTESSIILKQNGQKQTASENGRVKNLPVEQTIQLSSRIFNCEIDLFSKFITRCQRPILARIVCQDQYCGECLDINFVDATIQSANYPQEYRNKQNCTIVLSVPLGSKILLNFTKFNLEEAYDFISISDGAGNLKKKLTGHNLPSTLISKDNKMIVKFSTDVDNLAVPDGVVLSWQAKFSVFNPTRITASTVAVSTSTTTKASTITTEEVSTIKNEDITTDTAETTSKTSETDTIIVTQSAETITGTPIATSTKVKPIVTSITETTTRLTETEPLIPTAGITTLTDTATSTTEPFTLKVEVTMSESPTSATQTSFTSSGSEAPTSVTSQATTTTTVAHEETTKTEVNLIKCNVLDSVNTDLSADLCLNITANSGIIQSPNYPNDYGVNPLVKYTIEVPPGRKIKLVFTVFVLEYPYDLIEIYDGTATQLVIQLTGYNNPDSVLSSTNKLIIRFHSDADNNYMPGFFGPGRFQAIFREL